MKFEFFYRMVLAAMLLALPPAAQARDLDHDEALRLRQEGVIRPLEALIATAFARYPGAELLEAELEEEDDVLVYEAPWMKSTPCRADSAFDRALIRRLHAMRFDAAVTAA